MCGQLGQNYESNLLPVIGWRIRFFLSILILFVFLFCCQFLLQHGEENGGEVDGEAGEPLGDGDVDGPKEVMGSCEIGEQVMEVSG